MSFFLDLLLSLKLVFFCFWFCFSFWFFFLTLEPKHAGMEEWIASHSHSRSILPHFSTFKLQG